MLISSFSSVTLGWFLITTGVNGLFGLNFIILFFTVGQPFGTLNDFSIGLTGILSGILVWLLTTKYLKQASFFNQISLLLAMIGVILVLVVSYRTIFVISGWVISGLYMAAGNVLIGIWLSICISLQYRTMPGNLISPF